MTRLLVTNIGRLFTATDAGVISGAAVLVEDDRIVWIGAADEPPPAEPDEVVDVEGALVTPGLIDAHTHPVYAGDRLAEISRRSSGASYQEIAAAGGGIRATVAATRSASHAELARLVGGRLRTWLVSGTTTVEAKTGYHLDREGELAAVALLAGLGKQPGMPRVEVTFLAAHDLAPEFAGASDSYDEQADAAAAWCVDAFQAGARFVDVFCDAGYFSVEQARRVLRAGAAAGLRPRIHADELARTGGSLLAAEVGAASADHLLCATAEDADALARAGVVATLCPVTAMALHRVPPARLLADCGVTLALGSDHNPGQSGTTSMSLVVGLAVHVLGLSVDEALRAATVGAAPAVDAPDRGQVRTGMLADLVAWDTDHEGAFAWQLGLAPRQVWKGGVAVDTPAELAPVLRVRARRTGASSVVLRGHGLTPHDVVEVARRDARVTLASETVATLQDSRAVVERLARGDRPVYGITTGFGALSLSHIPPEQRRELQHAVVRSHAAGMGPPVEREVVRAMMLLRARSLAMGYSGVRPVVVQGLLDLLNAGITPVVPEYGSLGASGDLAPLAHMSLSLLGEGDVDVGRDDSDESDDDGDDGGRDSDERDGSVESDDSVDGGRDPSDDSSGRSVRLPAARALREAGLEPLTLEAKEGLALLNGTDGMLGMLLLACRDADGLLATADVAAAMSIEALLGTDRVFAPDLHALRPHPGQAASAANLARLLAGSRIVASHRHDDPRVQDAYSMRCAPQVLGAARDTVDFARMIAGRELDSAVDNPVVMPDGRVESTGNFHGAPLGYACDFLAVALTDVASLAERRIDRLLDATRSAGLPPFLATDAGVNSGLMIAQYTAAALVAESRQLAYPASVDSVPTSGMQEDHVSMGWTAARKLRRVAANTARVIAVELVCAAAGLDFRGPLRPAAGTQAARAVVRGRVAGPGPDRVLAPDLAAAAELVSSGAVSEAVGAAVGPLA